MRIIAGKLGGQIFDSPHGHRTHPMSEKMRGAIFNALGDIEGLTVFDPFAGSGALSFEAISRGAQSALAIDEDRNAFRTIQDNIAKFHLDKVKVVKANASSWSDNNATEQFDIVLLDPPYDDIKDNLLIKLANHANSGGIVAISLPNAPTFMPTTNYQLLTTKTYGDSTLVFYRKID